MHDTERTHDEVWARALEQVRKRGGGLAESHVIGQAPAKAHVRKKLHPGQAAPLVVAELAMKCHALLHFLEPFVRQTRQQRTDP